MSSNPVDISKFERLAATLPPDGYLRIEHLATNKKKGRIGITGLSEPTIWRRSREGTFPEAVQIGARATGWRIADIREWLNHPANYRQNRAHSKESFTLSMPMGKVVPAPLNAVIYPQDLKADSDRQDRSIENQR